MARAGSARRITDEVTMRTRFVLLPAAALIVAFLIAVSVPSSHAGGQEASASCTGPQQITFAWNWNEYPSYPTGHPEWIGYDVLRRPINTCGPFERLNSVPIPRPFEETHSRTFVDTPPSTSETYEYQAIPVDANRDRVHMLSTECDPPCVKPAWASCPTASAPLTVGLLVDMEVMGLIVQPCAGSCYWGFWLSGSPIEQELRDQGRVGTMVKLYGTGWCCGLEGTSMNATAWEPSAPCVTPTARTSWGELKTIYR